MLKNIENDLKILTDEEGYRKIAKEYITDKNVVKILKQLYKDEGKNFNKEVAKLNDLFS